MKKLLLLTLLIVTIYNPVFSMTLGEYQERKIIQDAIYWQERVSDNAKKPQKSGKKFYYKKSIYGIAFDVIDGKLTVTHVRENSEAEKAGIKEGDIINKIGSYYTDNATTLWDLGNSIKDKSTIIINNVPYEVNTIGRCDENFIEIFPKFYIDIASINIKNGVVFFWIKYLKGNEIMPIESKDIAEIEDAYAIDCINHKISTVARYAFNDKHMIIYNEAKGSSIAERVTYLDMGFPKNSDYSGLEWTPIIKGSIGERFEKIAQAFLNASKNYRTPLDFQATLRYF